MKKILKYTGLGLLVIFIIAQFFQVSKTNPEVIAEKDFINMVKPTEAISKVLKTACYDCHSHETRYPWYTYVVPVGHWIKNHVKQGTKHLNFSVWGDYSAKKADHKLEECVEFVEEKKMPLNSYTITHRDAILSESDRIMLIQFFNGLRGKVEEIQ